MMPHYTRPGYRDQTTDHWLITQIGEQQQFIENNAPGLRRAFFTLSQAAVYGNHLSNAITWARFPKLSGSGPICNCSCYAISLQIHRCRFDSLGPCWPSFSKRAQYLPQSQLHERPSNICFPIQPACYTGIYRDPGWGEISDMGHTSQAFDTQ